MAIPNMAGKVLTVLGPVDPSAIGPALMHEHIFIDFQSPGSVRQMRFSGVEDSLAWGAIRTPWCACRMRPGCP